MTTVPPVLWFALAATAQWGLSRGRRPTPASAAAAAALAGAAAALAQPAVASFRRRGTTVNPQHPERAAELVTTGVFGLTRNPMYLALAALLLAHAAARRSVSALLPAAGFVAVLDRTQVPAEEAALADLFGDAHLQYRARVPRWLGLPR